MFVDIVFRRDILLYIGNIWMLRVIDSSTVLFSISLREVWSSRLAM